MKKNYFEFLNKKEKEIIVNKGTEAPFSGEYNNHFDAGIFVCRACSNILYESASKFNSGCGWPSFDDEIPGAINRYEDKSLSTDRVEICCSRCDGHLGHVFTGENVTKKNTRHCVNSLSIKFLAHNNLETATFGAGCFWAVQNVFSDIIGVYDTQVGYMGGTIDNPTYEEVCLGQSKHAEVVQILYDSRELDYKKLLNIFWNNHNPTTLDCQGSDIGTQYRSVIFHHSSDQKKIAENSRKQFQQNFQEPIVTKIISHQAFYRAEEYHQDYMKKNNLGQCSL
jgi:peptide methionine sulfoxide reductase msrA/msrB|tara:strand:+ start:3024 stop:3866 length:843 start_codon:yes stop_codon:yes gene_type:complete